jgi:hypothetical protein
LDSALVRAARAGAALTYVAILFAVFTIFATQLAARADATLFTTRGVVASRVAIVSDAAHVARRLGSAVGSAFPLTASEIATGALTRRQQTAA